MERLALLEQNFSNILDLTPHTSHLTTSLCKKYDEAIISGLFASGNNDRLIDEEDLEFDAHKFDLVTYSLGLHWINDVQRFLQKIKYTLKPNGVFIGNFIGGGSLKGLRRYLIHIETKFGRRHSPHISPFIHFDHTPPLLSCAGFVETIVDYENIELNFQNALQLMRVIQKHGEANALTLKSKDSHTISKKMFAMFAEDVNQFHDEISLVSFIASPSKNTIKLKL